jgi:hypothetical protein
MNTVNTGAFTRAPSMMAAIGALLAQGLRGFELQQGISSIGAYKSRGKGGKRPHRSIGTAAHQRHARKLRNQARNRRACRG